MSILTTAEQLINGPRQKDYGHPFEDFTRTGKMWGAILGTNPIPPETVALMMVALKISRECNQHKEDNLIDGAGYFGTIELIHKVMRVNSLSDFRPGEIVLQEEYEARMKSSGPIKR